MWRGRGRPCVADVTVPGRLSRLPAMSGKHVKVRAWRRGGGTPWLPVLIGLGAWALVALVLVAGTPRALEAQLGGSGPSSPSAVAPDPSPDGSDDAGDPAESSPLAAFSGAPTLTGEASTEGGSSSDLDPTDEDSRTDGATTSRPAEPTADAEPDSGSDSGTAAEPSSEPTPSDEPEPAGESPSASPSDGTEESPWQQAPGEANGHDKGNGKGSGPGSGGSGS